MKQEALLDLVKEYPELIDNCSIFRILKDLQMVILSTMKIKYY